MLCPCMADAHLNGPVPIRQSSSVARSFGPDSPANGLRGMSPTVPSLARKGEYGSERVNCTVEGVEAFTVSMRSVYGCSGACSSGC